MSVLVILLSIFVFVLFVNVMFVWWRMMFFRCVMSLLCIIYLSFCVERFLLVRGVLLFCLMYF